MRVSGSGQRVSGEGISTHGLLNGRHCYGRWVYWHVSVSMLVKLQAEYNHVPVLQRLPPLTSSHH